MSNKMEDLLNYTTMLEGAEEAAIKQIAEDDEMYNTGKEWYFSVGFDGLRAILNVLQIGNVRSIGNILDLPCGHGRVGRYLRSAFPDAEMTFCDVNRSGVDYCAQTFSGRGIYSQIELEQVDLGRKFDLIWVGSLFTHIDYRRYKHWMEFLAGQLAPNGVLVVTLHGPGAIQFASKYPMLESRGLEQHPVAVSSHRIWICRLWHEKSDRLWNIAWKGLEDYRDRGKYTWSPPIVLYRARMG